MLSNTKRKASRKTQRYNLVKESLLSVAGLIGRPVLHAGNQEVGTVADLVVRLDTKEPYPPLSGILVKVARRVAWIPKDEIAEVTAKAVRLKTTRLDLEDFVARPEEVCLGRDVLDHQLVDVDGVRVVRASDLYVTPLKGEVRLVGVDTGFGSLLRRLGPARWRSRATPGGVINWASIQSFGSASSVNGGLKLAASRGELQHLRPGELADLLEDLGRSERQELLTALPVEQAADALEEMQADELETLLRESEPESAADLLANMEPDEAADALRDVDQDLREDLLAHMTDESAELVQEVLAHPEHTAGGSMNTALLTAQANETGGELQQRLKQTDEDFEEAESIAVIDEAGKLVYDLPLIKLFVADPKKTLISLAEPSDAVATVLPEADIEEVAEALIVSRRSSVIVVNEQGEPLGRILADDVIDAMLPEQSHIRFPRILS